MIKCIVPVSGGKDSQACLQMAVEEFGSDHVLGLFCDTQFEHPLTYQHIENLKAWYGVRIDTVTGGEVLDQCIKNKRFPSGAARFCTYELKIKQTRIYLKEFGQKYGPVQLWYGMRHDESDKRAKKYGYVDPDDLYPPDVILPNFYPKYLFKKYGIQFRLPIVDWYDQEVFDYIGDKRNPLYDQGFPRVGCFPCLASGDKWKIKAFTHDDFGKNQLIKVRQLETELGKSIFTAKLGQRFDDSSQGCVICQV